MCIAVGNVSLEDWDLFTWSLGWTGVLEPSFPPRISIALLLMTYEKSHELVGRYSAAGNHEEKGI